MTRSRKPSGRSIGAQGPQDAGIALHALSAAGAQPAGSGEYAVLVMDADGTLVDWNTAAERIFGYAGSEVLGKPVSTLFPVEASRGGEPAAWLAKAAASGGSNEERWLMRKNGTRFWASGAAAAVRGPDGGLQGCIFILRDMTGQKLALEQAREGEEKFRMLLDSLPEGIFGVDREGKCTFANTRCLEMLGYGGLDQMLGEDMHARTRHSRTEGSAFPESGGPLRAAIKGARLQGEDIFRRRDGSPIRVEYLTYPMLRGGEYVGAMVTFTDITLRQGVEAGRRTQESKSQQVRKMESVGRLAGGVAHEFNNALTAVTGFSELLLDRLPPDDPLRGSLEEISKGGQKLAVLTQQLLSYGRRQTLQARKLDLNAFVRERKAGIQAELGKEILLSMELEPESSVVRVDPERFEDMILDLARNVKSAIPGPGRLILSTRRADFDDAFAARPPSLAPGVYACLCLRDTRADMPPEIADRLFEPYGATQSLAKEPTGMALASAYGFIRQSGGDLLVHAEAGRGILFEIFLPACAADLIPEIRAKR